jgi:Transglycosylase SLT domain
MNPLIGLAITLVPQLLQFFAGDKAGQIGKKVTDAVADVTKTRSTEEAIKKVNEDPKVKADLQAQLAQIALAAQRASYEDAQSERDSAYKADVLALQSTAGARQAALGFAASGPWNASAPAILSYTVVAGFLVILGFMSAGKLNPPNNDGLFQTMNILIGALAAAFATVLNFWLGSSLGSRRKDAVVEYQAAQPQQGAGGSRPPGDPGPPVELPKPGSMESGPSGDGSGPRSAGPGPERPASPGLLREIIPELVKTHRHFPNGVSWKLTPAGIAIEGAPPMSTPGEPSTVRNIWKRYGDLCASFARQHGVPVELIVATIATESGGDSTARRPEPKIGDESVGLMQTLVGTARQALGRKNVNGDDLTDAATSIDAGTAYIAQQRKWTCYDPPRVAAAYNAGSIRLEDSERNRWKLLCYPLGTGHHVDKFVAFFSDCMKVSGAEHWGAVAEVVGI